MAFPSFVSAQQCGFSSSDILSDSSFYSPAPSYGGILLDVVAELLANDNYIFTGGTFDPASGQIILFSTNSSITLPKLDPDDLVVAIRAIYEYNEPPGVSIGTDGVDSNGNFIVRYDGYTRDTKFGQIMFEADLLLKWLTMGVDNDTGDGLNYAPQAETFDPTYKTVLDYYIDNLYSGQSGENRIWFVPKHVKLVPSADGASFVFDDVAIEILTESTHQGNVVSNPCHEMFAQHLRDNWDLYTSQNTGLYRQLKQLERLARIAGVVQWLKDNEIPVDLSFVEDYEVQAVTNVAAVKPTTVSDSFSYVTSQGNNTVTHTKTWTITGGVSYNTPNTYQGIDTQADTLKDATLLERQSNLGLTDDSLSWGFSENGKNYNASALSLSRSGTAGAFKLAQTDLAFPVNGASPLTLTRYYDTFFLEGHNGLGRGWCFVPNRLVFPEAKETYVVTLSGSGTIMNQWYPEIKSADAASGKVTRYILDSIDSVTQDPIYQADQEAALSESRLRIYQNPDESFTLRHPDNTPPLAIDWSTDGFLTRMIDDRGHEMFYFYDNTNFPSHVTRIESGGRAIHITLDPPTGRPIQAEGPSAVGATNNIYVYYTYNDPVYEGLTDVVDIFAHTIRFYYSQGLLFRGVKILGGQEVTVVENDYQNPVTSETDKYRRSRQIVSYPNTIDASSNSLAFASSNTFDATLGESARADVAGDTASRVDEKNRFEKITHPDGSQVTLDYTGPYGPDTITDRGGHQTHFQYDTDGMVTGVEDPLGRQVNAFYYVGTKNIGVSYISTAQDPLQYAKAFIYNENNQVTKMYHTVTGITSFPPQWEITLDPVYVTDFDFAQIPPTHLWSPSIMMKMETLLQRLRPKPTPRP